MSGVREKTAPLSHQQERMYLFEALDSGSSVNNLAFLYWIDGDLDTRALIRAIAELHARHDVLRTRYPSQAQQVVAPIGEPPLFRHDLAHLTDAVGDVVRLVDTAVNKPFDLAAAPPVYWSLYTLGPSRHALVLVLHHIIFDAWSKAVINRELSELYDAFHHDRPTTLADLPTQYADYATRQRARNDADTRAEVGRWARQLAGAPAVVRLPFDRQPDENTGFAGAASHVPMRRSPVRQAEQFAQEERSSLFMVLLAAFVALLARYDDRRDMVIGVPTAGRDELGAEELIGCFVDTVPFRISLAGVSTFRELVARVRDVTLDVADQRTVPLARLVAALRPEREPGREPLVQVVFQMGNAPTAELRLTGSTVVEEGREPTSTGLDLTVTVTNGTGGPAASWQYKTELFDSGTIERLQRDFEHIVERATIRPDIELAELVHDGGGHAPGTATAEQADAATTEPRTAVERLVARIWSDILDVPEVGVEDNFFDLGGHSLTAGQVIARLGERVPTLSTRGLLRDVLRYPVLGRFAAVLAERIDDDAIEADPSADSGPVGRIPVIDRDGPVPLSLGQQRLWFVDQFAIDRTEYLVPMAMRITGRLDVNALTSALREIVDRHEVLRTAVVVVNDEPRGLVRSVDEFTVDLVDLDSDADVVDAVTAEGLRPLDLTDGLPIRACLLRLHDLDHVLCVTVHHMTFDGWSNSILQDELETLYGAFADGRPSPLAPIRVQYADVAAFQQSREDSPEFVEKLDFWRTTLAGGTAFELAPDLPRQRLRTSPGALCAFTVSKQVTEGLERIASRHGATLFMALLAAWQTLLHRYSGAEDITVGTTAAEREYTETEPLIGFFINMLVLRGDVTGGPSFAELLVRTRDRTLDAYANQNVPFDRLVAELAGERDLSRTPLFQIVIQLTNARQRQPALPGLVVRPQPGPTIPAKYDIELTFTQVDGGLDASLRYDKGLYLSTTIDRLIGYFGTLLGEIVERPDSPIAELSLADPAELARVRALTASPQVEFPDCCLHQLVEDQVRRTPDAVAVEEDGDRLTYAELDAWANRIAVTLRGHGVGPDVVVGVLLDRSVGMVAAVLGVLKAGGAYLPLETDAPPTRISQLLADCRAPVCLVSDTAHHEAVTRAGCGPLALPERGGPAAGPRVDVLPGHLVAVYYTSGSTGRPKGVGSTHAGWVNRMNWMRRHHPLRPGETVLQKTTLTFDDAAVEIIWPLMSGARVALLGPGLHRDPMAIVAAAIRYEAVHVQFVPSMLDLFLETLTDGDVERLGALRSVLSSGEALRPALVRRFGDRFGDRVVLDNVWGATEVSIDSTCRVSVSRGRAR